MLQKKRDQFRKEIRRSQLDKFREEKRKALQSKHVNIEVLQQVDSIFSQIEMILVNAAKVKKNLSSIPKGYANQQQESSAFYSVIQCFQKLKIIAPFQFQQIFTRYMMENKAASRIINFLVSLIENQHQQNAEFQSTNEQLQQNQDQAGKKYPSILRERTVYELVKFLDTLVFVVLGTDVSKEIVDGLWKLFTEGEDLLYSEVDQFGCLKYTLSILTKLLQDHKNDYLYRHMVKKGLGNIIVRMISRLKKLQIPLQVHDGLLHLIENYISSELAFPSSNPDKIGQVTIQTSNVNQKQILFVYCIVFIDKEQELLYSIVFSCISKILDLHSFLVTNLKEEYWIKVCKLILHPKRDIQTEALNLLNDFTYHSQLVLDYLLKNYSLFDVLFNRLIVQKNTNDQFVTSNVQKIADIICNSLMTEKLEIRKACLNHYLWEEIYSSINPSNKLFPLVMTMPYFFEYQSHKNFQNYLRPYFQTLRNFEWQKCRYSGPIRDSILRIFYKAQQQWQQHEYILLLKVFYENGFLNMVEDLVELDDLKNVKEIQIQ